MQLRKIIDEIIETTIETDNDSWVLNVAIFISRNLYKKEKEKNEPNSKIKFLDVFKDAYNEIDKAGNNKINIIVLARLFYLLSKSFVSLTFACVRFIFQ